MRIEGVDDNCDTLQLMKFIKRNGQSLIINGKRSGVAVLRLVSETASASFLTQAIAIANG